MICAASMICAENNFLYLSLRGLDLVHAPVWPTSCNCVIQAVLVVNWRSMQLTLSFAFILLNFASFALAASPSTTDVFLSSTPLDIAGINRSLHSLQTALPLYCNVTGVCSKCSASYLHTDACKHSGHAEKLLCITDSQPAHQVVLHLHRRINTAWQPLHISRSCPDPDNAKAAAALAESNSSSSISHNESFASTPAASPEAESASQAPTGSDLQQSAATSPGLEPATPSQTEEHLPGPALPGVGGWGLLHFELVMVLLLSGALPVVFLRKRRYVRL